jgi:hypothetical protein
MTPRCTTTVASFETRLTALLRMRGVGGGIKKNPHPEEARSAVSKDARPHSSRNA